MLDNNCDNCRYEEVDIDEEPCKECMRLSFFEAEYFAKWEPKGVDQ